MFEPNCAEFLPHKKLKAHGLEVGVRRRWQTVSAVHTVCGTPFSVPRSLYLQSVVKSLDCECVGMSQNDIYIYLKCF